MRLLLVAVAAHGVLARFHSAAEDRPANDGRPGGGPAPGAPGNNPGKTQEKPVAEKPVAEKPVAEKRVAEKPVAEKPVAEKPVAEKPVAAKPVAEKPVAEKPVAEKPVAEKPVAEKPVAEKPVAEKPVAEKPVAAKPVAEKPVAAKPVAEKPVAAKPVAEKPVAEKPVAEKPVAEKPVAEKPVAEKPVAEKPVAEKPVAAERPLGSRADEYSSAVRAMMAAGARLHVDAAGKIRDASDPPGSPVRPAAYDARGFRVAAAAVSREGDGSSPASACTVGEFYNATASACAQCVAGKYTKFAGLSHCSDCPGGEFAAAAAATACEACPANTFSLPSAASCTTCPSGKSSTAGSVSCSSGGSSSSSSSSGACPDNLESSCEDVSPETQAACEAAYEEVESVGQQCTWVTPSSSAGKCVELAQTCVAEYSGRNCTEAQAHLAVTERRSSVADGSECADITSETTCNYRYKDPRLCGWVDSAKCVAVSGNACTEPTPPPTPEPTTPPPTPEV